MGWYASFVLEYRPRVLRLFFGPWQSLAGPCRLDKRRLDQRPTSQDARGFYPMTMMREPSMMLLIVLSAALATPAPAQTGNILSDNYSIMVPEKGSKQKASKQKISKPEQPEPWLAPKYKSPSGTGTAGALFLNRKL